MSGGPYRIWDILCYPTAQSIIDPDPLSEITFMKPFTQENKEGLVTVFVIIYILLVRDIVFSYNTITRSHVHTITRSRVHTTY